MTPEREGPVWFRLLSPLPEAEGDLEQLPVDGSASRVRVRLVLGNRRTGMRIFTATHDADGTLLAAMDLILQDGGNIQESARGSMDPVRASAGLGTYWFSEGPHHWPRALKDSEHAILRGLALSLLRRARIDGPAPDADSELQTDQPMSDRTGRGG
jgi:hypothetical protein